MMGILARYGVRVHLMLTTVISGFYGTGLKQPAWVTAAKALIAVIASR
jgi:hypothetical protein